MKVEPKAAKQPEQRDEVLPPTAEKPTTRPGRPSTITPQVIERIAQSLRAGHSRKVAARVAGVNDDAMSVWMLRGRESKDDAAPTRQLYLAVLEAEGVGLQTLEQKALAGADIDHVQALRLLERRDPETWARREPKPATDGQQTMEVEDVRKLLTDRLSRFLPGPADGTPAPSPDGADSGAASGAGSEPA